MEIDNYRDMEESYTQAMPESIDPEQASAMSMFGLPNEDNLIRWQLDLREDIDRIYHLLKGDKIKEDKEGNIEYEEADHYDLKPFNEFGVQMIMNIISFYLNRNTLLSNYDEDTINSKVLDFGRRLSTLIHNRYEEIMITVDLVKATEDMIGKKIKVLPNGIYVTDFRYEDGSLTYNELPDKVVQWRDDIKREHLVKKMKMYEMLVGCLVDSVHSAYLRAYRAGERESLRTARHVSQTEPIMQQSPYPTHQPLEQKGGFSLGNPRTWVR